MRVLLLLLSSLVLAACSAPGGAPGSATPTTNAIARISPAHAAAIVEGKRGVIVDVRTPGERQTAHIEGSRLLDDTLADELMALPKDRVLVFQCHHGHRSQRAAELFVAAGFLNVYNLVGGIEAWSEQIDPNVPRY